MPSCSVALTLDLGCERTERVALFLPVTLLGAFGTERVGGLGREGRERGDGVLSSTAPAAEADAYAALVDGYAALGRGLVLEGRAVAALAGHQQGAVRRDAGEAGAATIGVIRVGVVHAEDVLVTQRVDVVVVLLEDAVNLLADHGCVALGQHPGAVGLGVLEVRLAAGLLGHGQLVVEALLLFAAQSDALSQRGAPLLVGRMASAGDRRVDDAEASSESAHEGHRVRHSVIPRRPPRRSVPGWHPP